MKRQILIIEDNYYKYFTTKEVIQSQLRMQIQVIQSERTDLMETAEEIHANTVFYKPEGGVAQLLEILKRRNVNRRNSEITMLLTPEMDNRTGQAVLDIVSGHARAA